MPSRKKSKGEEGPFLSLAPHCFLKRLESPSLYDRESDELYDLDEEAFRFLASGPTLQSAEDTPEGLALARTCLDEGLLLRTDRPPSIEVPERTFLPSLRYLIVHVTDGCNLRCRHCFLGKPSRTHLPLEDLRRLLDEFRHLQGLRLIISGGEPLLHPRFEEINDLITGYPFRTILLSNGTLIDEKRAGTLRFHEVQVSIDGMRDSHELLRGRGSYEAALSSLGHLSRAGIDLSVATMAHRANVGEFDRIREVLSSFPLKSWSVDVPVPSGNLLDNPELAAEVEMAVPMMGHSFGSGYYGSSGDYACGAHLAAVMADGSICKCSHYGHRPEGHISHGLERAWRKMSRLRIGELSCRCSHLESCRGGCRYRAEISSCIYGPDPIHCFSRGVAPGGDLQECQERTTDMDEGR